MRPALWPFRCAPFVLALVTGTILCRSVLAQGAASDWQFIWLPTLDGPLLATRYFVPPDTGPFPTLLLRTPYNWTVMESLVPYAVANGYALVVQNVRGTGGSQGEAIPFTRDDLTPDAGDGAMVVEWIAQQPWSNGKVGAWGASAQGLPIYGLLARRPPHLTSAFVYFSSPNLYRDWAYPGGAWREMFLSWWIPATPWSPGTTGLWQSHPFDDFYWQSLDCRARLANATVPAVHVGGWYDLFGPGTLEAFTRSGGGERVQRLIVGPWGHGIAYRQVGDLLYPINAATYPTISTSFLKWFDYSLKGVPNGIAEEPAVTYYLMGDTITPGAPGNAWRGAASWPPPSTPMAFYLTQERTLSDIPPSPGGYLVWFSDPAHPVPTVGGPHFPSNDGPRNQAAVEARSDVLAFTGPELAAPLTLIGTIRAELFLASTVPDFDLIVKVCDVYPDGRSFNVTEGILRSRFRHGFHQEVFLPKGQVALLSIDLNATAICLNQGHRLRVQVASSSSPGYAVNPQTGPEGGPPRVAGHVLLMYPAWPSRIVVPVSN